MALVKQTAPLSFTQGVDTKTDPNQVPPGKFLSLVNSVFTKIGQLTKRNGFPKLVPAPVSSSSLFTPVFTAITTFKNAVLLLGNTIGLYSAELAKTILQSVFYPVSLSVIPIYRSSTNQSACDSVTAANGLVCTVFTDNVSFPGGSGSTTLSYKYVISNGTTGQTVTGPVVISTGGAGVVTNQPRVFLLAQYFIVVFCNVASGTSSLYYIAIPIAAPASPGLAVLITSAYTPNAAGSFDGFPCSANGNLYLAWNGNDSGGAVRALYLSPTLVQSAVSVISGMSGSTLSVTADVSTPTTPVIWITAASSTGFTTALSASLVPLSTFPSPIETISVAAVNVTSVATGGQLTIFYEVANTYGFTDVYGNNNATNIVYAQQCNQSGIAGFPLVFARSVGLASKAFFLPAAFKNTIYVLVAYQSEFQPTYFLMAYGGQIISATPAAKLAYQNGGGYITTGLPNVTVSGNSATIPYLYKDLVAPANKSQFASPDSAVPVYSQTGVNLATFTIGVSQISTAEVANDLHLSGGFLWSYDGARPVEHNFHVYPDSIGATFTSGSSLSLNAQLTNGSNILTSVSSTSGLAVGQIVANSNFVSAAYVVSWTSNTITVSSNASATTFVTGLLLKGNQQGASGTNAITYFYQVCYEWTDNQGNVHRSSPSVPVSVVATANGQTQLQIPTLRLTAKTNVRIVIYRWATDQESYYEITSLQNPLLNNPGVDSITYLDAQSSAQILGNTLLYTTGGIVENIAAPATNAVTLWKGRLWLIDAEDENLLWYSKPVVESAPVEFSDLFTLYTSPTVGGAQNGTGANKCLYGMDDKLILFKAGGGLYYLTGDGPSVTGNNDDYTEPVFITSTLACDNQASIVFTPEGLMFQATQGQGIWLLGRNLSTRYIGAPVEAFNSQTVLSALQVPGTTQVRFTMSGGQVLMYDYFFDQWATFTGIGGVSSTVYQGMHTYLDALGNVFQETPGVYADNGNPVCMSFTTSWFSFSNLQGYQRAYWFYLLATYYSPHKINLGIAYDYEPEIWQTTQIAPANFTGAYGSDPFYGTSSHFGGAGRREQWQVFLERQRCQAFQITLSEQFDPTLGTAPGAGFTLSGINLVYGQKKGFIPLPAANQVG